MLLSRLVDSNDCCYCLISDVAYIIEFIPYSKRTLDFTYTVFVLLCISAFDRKLVFFKVLRLQCTVHNADDRLAHLGQLNKLIDFNNCQCRMSPKR